MMRLVSCGSCSAPATVNTSVQFVFQKLLAVLYRVSLTQCSRANTDLCFVCQCTQWSEVLEAKTTF